MSRLRALAAAAAPVAAFLLAPSPAFAQAAASPFTSATRYDPVGRVTGTITADPDGVGSGNPFMAVRSSYSPSGDLTKVEIGTLAAWQSESVLPSAWSGFSVDRTVETSYDAMGRKTRESMREGAAGPLRSLTQYSYDSFGRPDCAAIRMNPANFAAPPASACTQGTGGADRITRIAYDAADQRLQLRAGVGTAAEGTQATWTYNLNGQITTVIDGNGNRAELRYDGHGRQICWLFPSATRPTAFDDSTPAAALATAGGVNGNCVDSGDFERYGYDPNGNRTSLRKRDGRSIVFAYDALNRVTSKTYPDGGATAVFYGYDLRNLQLSARFTSQSGEGITSAYDGFGRLASSSTNMGGTTRTLGYQNDRNANRNRITHPDGVYFDTAYDGLNRPFYIDNWRIWFAYKHHGTPYAAVRANGVNDFLEYDGAQRLYSHGLYFNAPHAASAAAWFYMHNSAGQLASVARDNDAYAWTGAYSTARPYAANGLNQYATTGQPNTAGSVAFTYDANGNLASEATWNGSAYAVSTTYTYDVENRLIARSASTGNATLSYDPLGRLYEVTGNGNTTRLLYDGDALVAEYNASGAMTRRYVHNVGADVPLLSYAGSGISQPTYLHSDHQGSIVAVSDSAGAGTVNTYDEYGIPALNSAGQNINTGRFQYTGQIWLDEIGMYYYKARVYSPTLGRFLQIDPVGYDDQYNLHAYVGNDPVNNRDPTGRWVCAANSAAQCDTVAEGLRRARVALTRMRGADAARLRRSLAAWGARGVANGVVVQSDSKMRAPMSTSTRGGVTTVSVRSAIDTYDDLQQSSIGSGAAAVAHEGVHIDDQRNKFDLSNPRTRQEYYDSQRRAYRVQGEVDRALGVESSRGAVHLWRSNWGPSQEARNMNNGAFRATWDGICRPNCNGIEVW